MVARVGLLRIPNHPGGGRQEGRRATIKALPAPTDVGGLSLRVMPGNAGGGQMIRRGERGVGWMGGP